MSRNDLRTEIIGNSRALFETQGYAATTMRQIAQKSGCTAGSLYYFFAGGKAEILQEVIRSSGLDPALDLAWVLETDSFAELIDRLVVELPAYFQEVSKRLTWLQLDISYLGEEEIETMRSFPVTLFAFILQGVDKHLADPQRSRQVSWLIASALYGYGEMFARIGRVYGAEFGIEEMGKTVKTAVLALAAAEVAPIL